MERLLTSSLSLSKQDLIGPDQRRQRSHESVLAETAARLSESLIYDAGGRSERMGCSEVSCLSGNG